MSDDVADSEDVAEWEGDEWEGDGADERVTLTTYPSGIVTIEEALALALPPLAPPSDTTRVRGTWARTRVSPPAGKPGGSARKVGDRE